MSGFSYKDLPEDKGIEIASSYKAIIMSGGPASSKLLNKILKPD